jgi:hypothetical protein
MCFQDFRNTRYCVAPYVFDCGSIVPHNTRPARQKPGDLQEISCVYLEARIDHLLYLYDYFIFSCGDRPSLHRTAVFYEEAFPKDAQEHGTRTACERFTGSAVHVGGEVGYKHRATT